MLTPLVIMNVSKVAYLIILGWVNNSGTGLGS